MEALAGSFEREKAELEERLAQQARELESSAARTHVSKKGADSTDEAGGDAGTSGALGSRGSGTDEEEGSLSAEERAQLQDKMKILADSFSNDLEVLTNRFSEDRAVLQVRRRVKLSKRENMMKCEGMRKCGRDDKM